MGWMITPRPMPAASSGYGLSVDPAARAQSISPGSVDLPVVIDLLLYVDLAMGRAKATHLPLLLIILPEHSKRAA